MPGHFSRPIGEPGGGKRERRLAFRFVAPLSAPLSVVPAATALEVAAISAAVACFAADTAPAPTPAPTGSAWLRAALLEGTGREGGAPTPWGDPVPWG